MDIEFKTFYSSSLFKVKMLEVIRLKVLFAAMITDGDGKIDSQENLGIMLFLLARRARSYFWGQASSLLVVSAVIRSNEET